MAISGIGFNAYSMTKIQKSSVSQGTSHIQSVQQQSTQSATGKDRDGDSDFGKGVDLDPARGRKIDIRA
jgi:hypothetical protein